MNDKQKLPMMPTNDEIAEAYEELELDSSIQDEKIKEMVFKVFRKGFIAGNRRGSIQRLQSLSFIVNDWLSK